MKSNKFTLLELLLSVIGVLIIGVLCIPFTSKMLELTEVKGFIEITNHVAEVTRDTYKENFSDSDYECVIYDIRRDLGLESLGSYNGYSVVLNNKIHLFIKNGNFEVNDLIYTSKEDINGFKESVKDSSPYKLEDVLRTINCKDYLLVSKK